jgi:hypothetical protein
VALCQYSRQCRTVGERVPHGSTFVSNTEAADNVPAGAVSRASEHWVEGMVPLRGFEPRSRG